MRKRIDSNIADDEIANLFRRNSEYDKKVKEFICAVDAKQALLKRDFQRLGELIENGASINERYEKGDTMLHMACKTRDMEAVEFLIKKGADPNAVDIDGNSPLVIATCLNDTNMMEKLIKAGADVNKENFHKETPIYYAIKCGHLKAAEFLLKNNANINVRMMGGRTLLEAAVDTDNLEIVEFLLVNGIKKDETDALLLAIKNKNNGIATLLIEKGIALNTRSRHSELPLIKAIEYNLDWLVELMLKNGADPNLADGGGAIPIEKASKRIYKMLKKAGAKGRVKVAIEKMFSHKKHGEAAMPGMNKKG